MQNYTLKRSAKENRVSSLPVSSSQNLIVSHRYSFDVSPGNVFSIWHIQKRVNIIRVPVASLLLQFQDLACDWSEHNFPDVLGVHGFRSLTVKASTQAKPFRFHSHGNKTDSGARAPPRFEREALGNSEMDHG